MKFQKLEETHQEVRNELMKEVMFFFHTVHFFNIAYNPIHRLLYNTVRAIVLQYNTYYWEYIPRYCIIENIFLGIVLRIPTVYDFRVISAGTCARALTQLKKFLSS